MDSDIVRFRVTKLAASVPEGVPVEWQGKQMTSGCLTVELDPEAQGQGELDYERGRARVEFPVRLKFAELAATLESLGVSVEPVLATLRSEGEILEDHSFRLSGRCRIEPHALFAAKEMAADVLPGH